MKKEIINNKIKIVNYSTREINIKKIIFSIYNFTTENFILELKKRLLFNTTYSLLVKISSQNNMTFKMCGPQIGIIIKDTHDIKKIIEIYNIIMLRIESIQANYDFLEEIDGIEITITTINSKEELKLKNISDLNLNNVNINKLKMLKLFNQKFLPLTLDTNYFGLPVLKEELQNYVEFINNKNINNKILDFNPDKYSLFIYDSLNKENKFLIFSKSIEGLKHIWLRLIYEFSSGIFIKRVEDTLIFKDKVSYNNSLFTRKIDSLTLTIKNQKVINLNINNKLNPIKFKELKKSLDRNTNFGVFDLEALENTKGLASVYAAGFFTNLDKETSLFYLTDFNLDSNKLIIECLDKMLVPKYNNFIFYVHNLGNYDAIFLMNILLNTKNPKGITKYDVKTTMKDNKFMKIEVSYNKFAEESNKNIKIKFVDSLNLLNHSLDKLAKDFKLNNLKGNFPHSFVNLNKLNYIGDKPERKHYKDITDQEYNQITPINWNLKCNSLKYLDQDLKTHLDVMNEFSKNLYIEHNTEMTKALTITRLALNIFYSDFYKKEIPYINKYNIFNFIKKGYYGGITEVYKPYGKDLVYLDVNSLYPYSALNPLPGTSCEYIENFEDKGLNLDNLFGFFYAKVKTNNNYLGLLPIKEKNLIFPNGEFEGIWSSEELKFAKENGYEIKVIKGYNFNKVYKNFNDYIFKLYNIKANNSGSIKYIAKSLLNNLLGRFGLNPIKPITKVVSKEEKDFILSTREIISDITFNNNTSLITYLPIISKDICLQHGLDFIKVLEKVNQENLEKEKGEFKDISISTTAMVNAYARIFMNKIKLEIINNKGNLYYTDTDSIIIDKIYFNPNWVGKKIGQFKLEYEIKEAFFISNKTYCLILKNGETIIKTKGVLSNSLKVEDFIEMYWNNNSVLASKNNTIKNITEGSVLIKKKNVILDYNAYNKREKIYNKKGIWIDTKPLNYFN